MTSTVPAPPRSYSSLSSVAPSMRVSQPMPAPLSRVALAAKQNQVLALQALQAAAASASASSSSSLSSAAGSPPPSSSYAKSASGTVCAVGSKRGRKFRAFRAPSLAVVSKSTAVPPAPSSSSGKLVPLITTTVPHWSAEGSHPLFDPSSGKRSEIYSLTNDRYPGAPGTALAKAREAQQKAILSAKREAAKKLASKAELEHLGVKGLGKKRKSSSPYAAVGGVVQAAAVAQASSSKPDTTSQSMSRDPSRGRSSAKPQSETHLTVPSTSRSRRPASRASSPAPITAQAASSSRRAGTRSGSAAPADEESVAANGRNNRGSPSRGNSPPENSKTHHGLSSNAPFQSSPLAASAITMEPLLDTDDVVDQTETKPSSAPDAATARAAAANKRKASALSQEVLAEDVPDRAVSDSLDEVSKRLRRDDATDQVAAERMGKEGSPSSVSSSRRTSPRMTSRRIVAEA